MLHNCGANVRVLNVNPDLPDSVFVEDTAIVLDEVAIMASMGRESRRTEVTNMELELRKYRAVERISLPSTVEGGDVLRIGRKMLVGISSRTNRAAVDALDELVRRYGYQVIPVPVRDCLHLKTACTALPDESLLVNPAWLNLDALRGFNVVPIPESEPWGANVALVNGTVCLAAEHRQTAELIHQRGFEVRTTELSEFAKAEGGVTCLSILISA
ncbi:MAG TPA: arginine deiminase family protein [Verrucomicrobiae bacterium]|jgi:dimethylargininase